MDRLLGELSGFGLEVEQVTLDGTIKRCRCRGSKQKNGWYVGSVYGGHIYCTYGDWRDGESCRYTDNGTVDTPAVASVWRLLKSEAEQSQEKLRKQAARKTASMLDTITPIAETGIGDDHPYLLRKGVKAYGNLLLHDTKLIVPVIKIDGSVTGHQEIYPDGSKYHALGTEKKGAVFVIPGSENTVCLCEGYATGATIHEATGFKVLVAMDAGNLIEVARQLYASGRYQKVMVCADNDHGKARNTGVDAARTIANECGFPFIYPVDIEGSDFNDLCREKGMTAVQEAIVKGRVVKVYERKESGIEHIEEILNPPGLLKDIAEYYNATAVKPQPLFGIAAGIILGSVVLGRRYNTGVYNNYPSLYVAIATKSGTGKDHVKTVVRKILKASGLDWLERSGGFTAANTVIKSLERQPLQVAFWEEFGLRLKEAGANNRSLYCGVFRQLLDIWSSCHSTSMGEEYADGTIPSVDNPAFTMVGMSTVKQLFEAMTDALIEQGFVNRILPFVSHAERTASPLNRQRHEPPPQVVEWCRSIWPESDGNLAGKIEGYACPGRDNEIAVDFAEDALLLLNEIEEQVVARCNELERIGLEDLPTRNREITMRVALIVAVMDRCQVIERRHVDWSWKLVSALYGQYVATIKRVASGSEFEQAKKRALEDLRKRGQEGMRACFMPKVTPWSKWEKRMRHDILAELQESGLAELVEKKQGRGPARSVWVAVENEE